MGSERSQVSGCGECPEVPRRSRWPASPRIGSLDGSLSLTQDDKQAQEKDWQCLCEVSVARLGSDGPVQPGV